MNVFSSPYASERLAVADEWLADHGGGRLVVCAASLGAAGEALRRLCVRVGAGAGWHRTTPGRLAAGLAAPRMAELGLAPAGSLTVQALCARVLYEGHARGTRLEPVADRPGMPRALARTLEELRLHGAEAPADLLPLARAYEAALAAAGLADRAALFALATEAAAGDGALLLAPVCFLDVDARTPREAALMAAVAARAPASLWVRPAVDARVALRAALEVFSSADEAREHVEVVRRVLAEAAAGTPLDRMAVLFRGSAPPSPLVEALGRGGLPVFHAAGRPVPDPGGRAFLALLACAEEGLSARRFAEYLSLGETAEPAPTGEPIAPRPPAERWAPADDDLLAGADERFGDDDRLGNFRATAWEGLLVEAGVFDDIDRWRRRLHGLEARIALELRDAHESRVERARRRIEGVRALRAFALPLVDDLAALPARAPWGEWLSRLSALATRALRAPDRVLALLAELSPMAPVGPIGLPEVRLVLGRRISQIVAPSEGPRDGRLFVGPIDAVRGRAFDVVFLAGVAEKLFPPKLVEDPLLPDAARPGGLPRQIDRAAGERLRLQLAAGAAGRRLAVSYPRLDEGRARVPSIYFQELVAAAEGQIPGVAELVGRAERSGTAPGEPIDAAEYDLRAIATAHDGSARYLLSAGRHLARALRARARRWHTAWTPADGLVRPSAEARAELARHSLAARSFSPTALQRFSACPYQFFLQAIHRLAPRDEPDRPGEMDPLTRGSLVHDVLCDFLTELREAGLLPIADVAAARLRLDRVLDDVAARYHEELAPLVERVWDDAVVAIRADLHEWLDRFVADPGWTPLRFELAFGIDPRDPDSRPEPAPLDCGVQLRGAIDLVERDAAGTLRATDYKTGKVRAQRGTVIQGGEILQPVFYALALEKLYPGTRVWGGRLHHITRAAGFEAVEIPLDDAARRAADQVAAVVGGSLAEGFFPAAPREGACRFCDYLSVCGPNEEVRTGRKPPLPRLGELRRAR